MAKKEAEKKTPKATPKKDAPKKEATKQLNFNAKLVSQSTEKVNFQWSKGKKSGTKESMSKNLAEILEGQAMGKTVK